MADTAFCKICRGSTSVIAQNDSLQAECNACHTRVDLPPHATLRYEESAKSNTVISDRMLKKAPFDPINKKIKKEPCSKCGCVYYRNIIVGDANSIDLCSQCGVAV